MSLSIAGKDLNVTVALTIINKVTPHYFKKLFKMLKNMSP